MLFLELGIVHIATFTTIVILFVLSLLVWPFGTLIRKRRAQAKPTGWARRALMLEIGVALLLLLGTVAFFIAVWSSPVS